MNEREFEECLISLAAEEDAWKSLGFTQNDLYKDRDATRQLYTKCQHVFATIRMWESTIRAHLNQIAKTRWQSCEFAHPIDLKKLQKSLYKNGSNVDRIYFSWRVHKKEKLWFIKTIPFFRVDISIPYGNIETKDSVEVLFSTTGMESAERLKDKDSLRDALIEMYEHGPDYENLFTKLLQVLFVGTDDSIKLIEKG